MDAVGDVRALALPCVLVASLLQYFRFAKKPMSAPCHRVSERGARRVVFVGLALELVGVTLLPLHCSYPMNASCLVLAYYWKETKHSSGCFHMPILAALAAWSLPLLQDGRMAEPLEVGALLRIVLAPDTCVYIVALLGSSILLHMFGTFSGESVLLNCAPPALNFGVSAILLKALTNVFVLVARAPGTPENWVVLIVLLVLLFGVRSAAATPLRRAMEVHDILSVLTSYGAVSSAAAIFSGCYVFDELKDFSFEQRALTVGVGAWHCWGLRALGQRAPKAAGKKDDSVSSAEANSSSAIATTPEKSSGGRRGGGGGGGGNGTFAEPEKVGRQAVEMSTFDPSTPSKEQAPSGPLLSFNEPRTVDEAAQMEEKLFARALAPQRLGPAMTTFEDAAASPSTPEVFVGGFGVPGAFGDPSGFNPAGGFEAPGAKHPFASSGEGETPQFDADFEEIMRHLEGDDRQNEDVGPGVMPIAELSPEVLFGDGPAVPQAALAQQAPPVLQFDATTLLDDNCCGEDEDELLRIIEDIDGP